MLGGIRFATEFRAVDENKTEVKMQSHYRPKNFMIKLMNGFIKKKMGKEVDLMMEGPKNFSEKGELKLLNPINRK